MTCQHCGREHPDPVARGPDLRSPPSARCPTTGALLSEPGLIGSRVDRYHIERLLGVGGFGAVYRARHVHTDATVALKLLKKQLGADEAMIERFLREARAAAAIGDEHIVRVMDAGISNEGQPFLALEFLDGFDLKELATREGPLHPVRLVHLTCQVLGALGAAHARGIVHRDMKPANVFVVRQTDERGVEKDFAKVLDFGISKMHSADESHGLTQTGVAMGTPAYMAPEQFFDARNVDGRADIYSVAVMLYELLTNRLPFEADSYAALIVKVRSEQPPMVQHLAPHVPAGLAQAVMTGLSKDPVARWQTTQEFAQALRGALGEPVVGSSATPAVPLQLKVTPIQPPERPALAQFTPALAHTAQPVSLGRPVLVPTPQATPTSPPGALKWGLVVGGVILLLVGFCGACLLYSALQAGSQ